MGRIGESDVDIPEPGEMPAPAKNLAAEGAVMSAQIKEAADALAQHQDPEKKKKKDEDSLLGDPEKKKKKEKKKEEDDDSLAQDPEKKKKKEKKKEEDDEDALFQAALQD